MVPSPGPLFLTAFRPAGLYFIAARTVGPCQRLPRPEGSPGCGHADATHLHVKRSNEQGAACLKRQKSCMPPLMLASKALPEMEAEEAELLAGHRAAMGSLRVEEQYEASGEVEVTQGDLPADTAKVLEEVTAASSVYGTEGPDGTRKLNMNVLGFITDSEKAARKALRELEKKYWWLVNLACQAHGLGNLIKDLAKIFPIIGNSFTSAHDIIVAFTAHANVRKVLREKQQEAGLTETMLRLPSETRFAGNVTMLQDVVKALPALRQTSLDDVVETVHWQDEKLQAAVALVIGSQFVRNAKVVLGMLQPVNELIHAIEKDSPAVSQVLMMWRSISKEIMTIATSADIQPEKFTNRNGETRTLSVRTVVTERYNKNFHPGSY
ncbi:hypothetical protein WJX72_007090 [[Myrmecia] bisecta]|uniref:Uncharacterized protein n=1 Tax=[Myrmecia] bisecta TaxID=41462 RepID=A0AAW1P6Z9_9CHLO